MRSIALLTRPTAAPLATRLRPRLRPARRAGVHGARVAVAAKDDLSESAVKDVKSTKELQDLIAATKGGGKLAVLEVRRVKASPAMEAFAPKYAAMAEDYADRATFATLFFDSSQATRLAAAIRTGPSSRITRRPRRRRGSARRRGEGLRKTRRSRVRSASPRPSR